MEYHQIILPSKKSVNTTDKDLSLIQSFETNIVSLPLNELEKVVSSYEVFLQERNASYDYRVYGNLFSISSNVLCELDGDYGFEGVEEARNFDIESQKYEKTLDEVLFKKNGWYYYIRNNDNCTKYELEPQKSKFYLTDKDSWNLYVTYPAEKNLVSLKFNDIELKDGIAIMTAGITTIDGKQMTYFVTPIAHNLSSTDKVNIYNQNGFVQTYDIYKLGLEDNTYKKNIFVVDEVLSFTGDVLANKYRFKKIIGNIESEYYGVWNKKMTNELSYEIFKTSFCENIYSDRNFSFVFPTPLNIENISDHLNRPLSELYLTIIKKTDNDFWGKVISGTNTFLSNVSYDLNTIYQNGGVSTIENDIIGTENYYFTGIREYNLKSLVESELSFAAHIFNSQNRIDNDLIEGYYYKPHYKIQIKNFSDFVIKEDGVVDIPYYANQIDGIYQWRDVLLNDNISFLNKTHYAYLNENFYIRRQDPCNLYELSSNGLLEGACLNNDIEKIIDVEKIC